ncbi:35418_t:CDS:1 [Gigaspora margarita]|uniref:35418_t:CDS:1 n=1 Tax=Gigaspora margarita TaxID=4874 RepID=A0ABN7VS26_GIGMA|nr:35418_t:CDS:1 [Gigaspora margarita]
MIRIKRADGVPKCEVNKLRKKLRGLIKAQDSKPMKGVMQFVALIDESLKCLKRQGFQYIQGQTQGQFHLIDNLKTEAMLVEITDNGQDDIRPNVEKRNKEKLDDLNEAARTAIVWRDGTLKVEEGTNYNEIGYWNDQDGEVIDEEDKEDVISLYASEFEFDDGIGCKEMDWI